ncbi:Mediator of RNA polymerase II transcription subunit 29 [Holothuria leucospilota]|uniref:Mediator of RNA polymerase II transcription subunit 29 n=1 Tax=Holothuria leucospilota TaxID=206669 RepID=A0A9Q1HGQ2_HOLLE|nr:Mediator of RNA polymerase II transcription subunit 29 [Holothuria leucospilota]
MSAQQPNQAVPQAQGHVPQQATEGQTPSGTTQATQQQHNDPIYKAKLHMCQLKECMAKLMKVAAASFQNAVDSESKAKEDPGQAQFDKCLEDFYALCDHIEIDLKLSLECAYHHAESHRRTPHPAPGKPNSLDNQTYSQLISTVKTQISCAQEVHDLLMECSKRLEERKT